MVGVSLTGKGVDFDKQITGDTFQPPPPGMTPIGDSGWYGSPDVVDPRDCDWYPDSPWCGGQPFDNSPLSISVSPSIDACGFTLTFGGTVGYVKLPNHAISYRYPGECRREEPPAPKPGGTKPPQPLNGFDGRKFDANTIYQFFVAYSTGWENSVSYISPDDVIDQRKLIAYKSNYYYTSYSWGIRQLTYSQAHGVRQDSAVSLSMADSKINCDIYYLRADGSCWGRRDDYDNRTYYYDYDGEISNVPIGTAVESFQGLAYGVGGGLTNIYYAKYSQLLKYCTWVLNQPLDTVNAPGAWQAWYLLDYRPKPLPYAQNPPPPKEDPRHCCMQCCPSPQTKQQDDSCCKQVLEIVKRIDKNLGTYPGKVTIFDSDENSEGAQSKVIEFANVSQGLTRSIERTEKISKIIGIDDVPLTVPKSIVDPVDQSLIDLATDFFTGDTEKINNLFEYHIWFLKQFSAVTGKFMIEIQVPDTDVLQQGNQGVDDDGNPKTPPKNKIVIPDLATALREIIMLQVALYKTLGLNLDTSLLTLSQAALCMKETARIGAEVDEIVDFLDYPTDDAARDVPVFVTVPEKNLTAEEQNDLIRYLKSSQVKVKYQKWDGKQSLRDLFIHFATRVGSKAG